MPQNLVVAHIHWHDTPGVFGGDHTDVPANAFLNANDADMSRGAPRRLGGYSVVGTVTELVSGIIAGHDWDPNGSSQIDIVVGSNMTVYKETASGSASYVNLVSGLATGTPRFVDGGQEITGASRKLFMFTGSNSVYVLVGTGAAMATITSPPSDWEGTNQPSFGTVHERRLWAGGVLTEPSRLYYSDEEDHEKFTTAVFRDSAYFDGTNDSLARGADLTGNANGKLGTIAFWAKIDKGVNKQAMSIVNTSSGDFIIRRTQQNKIQIQGLGTTATAVLKLTSNSNLTHKDGWFHVMAAWNLNTPIGYLKIDGKVDLATDSYVAVNADIKYTAADHFIGDNAGGGQKYKGYLKQLYLNYAEFLDISIAGNARNLYDDGAVELAATASGVTATGTPIVYLNQTATDFHVNAGGGGNYVVTGALVKSTIVPRGDLGGDPGSLNVFPGVGNALVDAVSFRGFLIAFKKPRGVFAINAQSIDQVEWSQQVLTHNIGIAGVGMYCVAEDALLFMSNDGDIHAVNIIQSDEQSSASITRAVHWKEWLQDNFDPAVGAIAGGSAVYYPDLKVAMFQVRFGASTTDRNIVVVDMNGQIPRLMRWGTATNSGLLGLWTMRDENDVIRPVFGSSTGNNIDGRSYFIYPSASTYDDLASGGSAPQFSLRTPNLDFREVDPSLMDRRKNGRWLEVVYEPCTGTVTLAAEVFWDGNSYATINFTIAASTGIGYVRRRLNGSGRTFGVRLYHPTPSTTTHGFAISNLNVYFVPGAASPT